MSIDETFQVTDLCQAATNDDIEKIRSILDRQPNLVNVHVTESNEHQAIHYAVINQNKNAVRLLMKRGANHTSGIYPHRSATSALTMAEDRGQSDIVQVIRDEDEKRQLAACQNITITPENDALFEAINQGLYLEALGILDSHPELIDACHRNGGSVIYTAACQGHYHLVKDLLNRGADINHLTPEGQSPLDGAVHNARLRHKPINHGCLICVGILMQAGCQVSVESAVALGDENLIKQFAANRPERFQSSYDKRDGLLQIAVENDNITMLELLISLGLDPDDRHQLLEYESKPFSWGQPLWIAAGESCYQIAEFLLEHNADPNASLYASGNPLSRAYNNRDEEMKGLLFRYGAELDPITAGLEGETSAAAVALQSDVTLAQDLLWAAGCGGDPNIVGMCLRHLDWANADKRWFNLLEQPLRQWRLGPHRKYRDFDRKVYFEIFEMILSHGASPNIIGRFGYRLAHHLAACGVVWEEPIMTETDRIEFATILLKYKADLNVIDDLLQSTPLGWAVRWGKYELAHLYLENGAHPTLAGAQWATPLHWAEKKKQTKITTLLKKYL